MMSWMDVFSVIFLAFFVFQGAQRGVVRTVLDIIAVLLAIFTTSTLFRMFSASLPFLKAGDAVGYVICFAVIFALLLLVLDILTGAIQKIVKIQFHGAIESLGGSFLGLVKGVLIVGVIIQLLILYPFMPQIKDAVDRSISKQLALPTLRQTYASTFGMFPKIDFFIQEKIIPATPSQVPVK